MSGFVIPAAAVWGIWDIVWKKQANATENPTLATNIGVDNDSKSR